MSPTLSRRRPCLSSPRSAAASRRLARQSATQRVTWAVVLADFESRLGKSSVVLRPLSRVEGKAVPSGHSASPAPCFVLPELAGIARPCKNTQQGISRRSRPDVRPHGATGLPLLPPDFLPRRFRRAKCGCPCSYLSPKHTSHPVGRKTFLLEVGHRWLLKYTQIHTQLSLSNLLQECTWLHHRN